MNVYLNALGMINALGSDTESVNSALFAGSTHGMVNESGWLLEGSAKVGRVTAQLPVIPHTLFRYASRNNQLLMAAFEQIRADFEGLQARYGVSRVGIVIGTSTSGISQTEAAVAAYTATGTMPEGAGYHYAQQEMGSPALFLSEWLQLSGIAYTVSTACTSSAKALIAAHRLITLGLCDVVIAGGVDSLCRLTLNGFKALESLSETLCVPMSKNRKGINIGEGAALFLVSRQPGRVEFAGFGESSDAYHISAPDPEGKGAEAAMRGALDMAGVSPNEIGYINLHGTATPKNDEMESLAVARVMGLDVPASSTKPLVGHTLGAAGATELAFCWLCLMQQGCLLLPPHRWDGVRDDALPAIRLVNVGEQGDPARRLAISNSFAFGGNNASLLVRSA